MNLRFTHLAAWISMICLAVILAPIFGTGHVSLPCPISNPSA